MGMGTRLRIIIRIRGTKNTGSPTRTACVLNLAISIFLSPLAFSDFSLVFSAFLSALRAAFCAALSAGHDRTGMGVRSRVVVAEQVLPSDCFVKLSESVIAQVCLP